MGIVFRVISNDQYKDYVLPISTDCSYYGSNCTQDDADRIAARIGEIAAKQFPGIQIRNHALLGGSGKVSGPNDGVCEEIRQWVEENWQAAL